MRFSLEIPVGDITPGEYQTADAIKEMSIALENAGIDACYVTDHPAPSSPWLHANGHDTLDPFTALAFVACASTRLLLHTNVIVMPYRNPFLTAKAAATLQILSGNRLILGSGGGYQQEEFDALGVDFQKRGALFDEALDVIRLAWAGGSVVKAGRNFNAPGNEPRPVPAVQPRIWIGGGSQKAIERAARRGDGWCPFFSAPTLSKANQESGIQSLAQLSQKIIEISETRARLGRDGQFEIAIGPRVTANFGSKDGAQQYIAALQGLAEVGVTWALIAPSHKSRQSYIENVQWFKEEVISRL